MDAYRQDIPEGPTPLRDAPRWQNNGTPDDNIGATQYNETNVSSAQFGTMAGGIHIVNNAAAEALDEHWHLVDNAEAGVGVEKPSVGTTPTISNDDTEGTYGPLRGGFLELGMVGIPVRSEQELTVSNMIEFDQRCSLEARKLLQRQPDIWAQDTLAPHLKAQLTSATPPSSKASRSRVSKASTRSADAQAEAACIDWVVMPAHNSKTYVLEEHARAVPDTTSHIAFAGVQFDDVSTGIEIISGKLTL